MAQQSNITMNQMPKIEIDCLKSMSRYLQKSQTHFKLEESKCCSITKGNTSLTIFVDNEYAVITQKIPDSDPKNIKQYKFKVDSIPKKYHYLYFYLLKMVKKLRERTIKYTIIRKRELDKTDKITCFISISGVYTIYFQTGSIARLNNKDSDIKFTANNQTKTIPFTYRNNKSAVYYNDAHDTMRGIVHELIRCAESVEKQKLKQLDYAKTWKIQWNADSGSVEDIKESILSDKDKYKYKQYPSQQEGLFKCNYQSDTTVSSDYSDTNSEMTCSDFRKLTLNQKKKIKQQQEKEGNKNEDDQSLSMVLEANKLNNSCIEASYSSINSIKSEASWRHKLNPYNNNNNSTVSSFASYQNDKQVHLQYLLAWNKQDVCAWLTKNNFKRDVCEIFWNHDIDGNALIKLSSNTILQMFARIHSVTNQDKKELILSINNLLSN